MEIEELTPYEGYVIRLSPIVKSELLRGCKTKRAQEATQILIDQIIEMPAPSNKMWEQAAIVLSKSSIYNPKNVEELQNDVLLALTARHSGAILITQDKDFEEIQKYLQFQWILHS